MDYNRQEFARTERKWREGEMKSTPSHWLFSAFCEPLLIFTMIRPWFVHIIFVFYLESLVVEAETIEETREQWKQGQCFIKEESNPYQGKYQDDQENYQHIPIRWYLYCGHYWLSWGGIRWHWFATIAHDKFGSHTRSSIHLIDGWRRCCVFLIGHEKWLDTCQGRSEQ